MAAARKPASKLLSGRDAADVRIVLVTAPPDLAETLARALLQERLIACANVVSGVTSLYWWEGQIQRDAEVILIMKTRRRALTKLHRRIRELHTYNVPEIVSLTCNSIDQRYAKWLRGETKSGSTSA